ncbi:MAG: dihydrodipicolinate synthase family protein [Actinobacteria bacterium]|nr:dihydrodipicolinate synthase family protein [Actinomycetota bacterium]
MTAVAVSGVLPVFQTPYAPDGSVDLETLEAEIRWILDQGADGVVMGMVSEVLRLSDAEVEMVANRACRVAAEAGVQCILSVGAESTHVAVERARRAVDMGATAVMAIPPLATAVADHDKLLYYRALLDAINIPVVVQDASGYVGQPLSIEMQARIAVEFPGQAVFKPEAQPIGPRVTALLEATSGNAKILEGTGGLALVDSFQRGIVGTMPGADVCWAVIALWRALKESDFAAVEAINAPLVEMISVQGELDSFLAVEKHLLQRQGLFSNTLVRGPVSFRLDPELAKYVDALFDELVLAVSQVRAGR